MRNTSDRCSKSCGPTASLEPQPITLSCWDVSRSCRAAALSALLYVRIAEVRAGGRVSRIEGARIFRGDPGSSMTLEQISRAKI